MSFRHIFLLTLIPQRLRIHISGVIKCVTKFLTLSKSPHCDSVKKFVTHFVTPEIWTLSPKGLLKVEKQDRERHERRQFVVKQRAKQRGSVFYSASKAALSTVKASSDGLLAFFSDERTTVEWGVEQQNGIWFIICRHHF